MKRKRKLRKKRVLFLIAIVAIIVITLSNTVKKLEAKRDNVARSNPNTQNDDRKLVKYSNFQILENLTGNKLQAAQLLNDIDECIIKDFAYIKENIKSESDIEDFYEKNKTRFQKDIFIIDIQSLKGLYKKLNENVDTDFSIDFETCEFEQDTENSITFKISYSNKNTILGIIILTEDGKIYVDF